MKTKSMSSNISQGLFHRNNSKVHSLTILEKRKNMIASTNSLQSNHSEHTSKELSEFRKLATYQKSRQRKDMFRMILVMVFPVSALIAVTTMSLQVSEIRDLEGSIWCLNKEQIR